MRVPALLVLQSLTSVARERHSGWSSDVSTCDRGRSLSEAPGWFCWEYGLSQLKSVSSVGYLQGRRTTLTTWSVRETEQDRIIQHGNGYLAGGIFLTCSVQFEHAQQPLISMHWASTQALIRYNMTSLISITLLLVKWSWFVFKLDWMVEAVPS